VAPILLILLMHTVTRASGLVQRQKTPDRRPNLSMPYIKLKVYGQTVWLDGGHGRIASSGSATVSVFNDELGAGLFGLVLAHLHSGHITFSSAPQRVSAWSAFAILQFFKTNSERI